MAFSGRTLRRDTSCALGACRRRRGHGSHSSVEGETHIFLRFDSWIFYAPPCRVMTLSLTSQRVIFAGVEAIASKLFNALITPEDPAPLWKVIVMNGQLHTNYVFLGPWSLIFTKR